MALSPAPDDPGRRCAVCGAAFHCGVADATPCWCTRLEVDPVRLAALARPDAGCLCPACLARASVQKETDRLS